MLFRSLFIKTDKMLTKRELTRKGEIADAFVLQFCTQKILEYQERLNRHDISQWTGAQVVEFLTTPDEVISFSDYGRKHIDRMIDRGQERNAKNYSRIAEESGRLNRLREQSKELHNAAGIRNTPTQFADRRAEILRKRANI